MADPVIVEMVEFGYLEEGLNTSVLFFLVTYKNFYCTSDFTLAYTLSYNETRNKD